MSYALRFAVFLIACPALGQSPAQPASALTPQTQSSAAPKGFVLEDATPVRMRINRTISSEDAHVGDTVDFEVLEDVLVSGVVVVPKGSLAFATVTEAQAKRRMARGGKLDINIDYVKLLDDEKAALRAVKAVQGGGHTGAMTGGIVATSLVFFPAAPFFLFMHGKDISIPKGTEITAYVNGDMKLDGVRFQPAQASGGEATSMTQNPLARKGTAFDVPDAQSSVVFMPAANNTAQLQLTSTPDGADIEIDGVFVGNTPSTIGVTSGQHDMVVRKSGFKPWERKIMVSSGRVKVNVELEADGR